MDDVAYQLMEYYDNKQDIFSSEENDEDELHDQGEGVGNLTDPHFNVDHFPDSFNT